ncbi:MAG: hypothetical protein M3N08_09310 [Pseudomonadota bacterium]|nr:hypothetical protein [Pseudomonadota bacterium]
MTAANHHSSLPSFVVAATLLVAAALPANAQFPLGLGRKAKQPAPAPTTTGQTAPVSSGVADVKWDGNTIRTANGIPMMIYAGTDKVTPTTPPMAVVAGGRVMGMKPGVDVAKLQKSLDDYSQMQARSGGSTPQTVATLSQPGSGGSASIVPPSAGGVDQVSWANGEPRVHLSDGWDVAFSGGNGSKVELTVPGGSRINMEFTEAAHGAGGIAKSLGTFVGSVGQNTAALEGGAWRIQAPGGKGYNQNNGTRNYTTRAPAYAAEAAAEVLKAHQVILASPGGHQYNLTGADKLQQMAGEPRSELKREDTKLQVASLTAPGALTIQ